VAAKPDRCTDGHPRAHQITFTIDAVTAGTRLLPQEPAKDALATLLNAPKAPLEAWSTNTPLLVKQSTESASVLHQTDGS
jgi:hypothetical protein